MRTKNEKPEESSFKEEGKGEGREVEGETEEK